MKNIISYSLFEGDISNATLLRKLTRKSSLKFGKFFAQIDKIKKNNVITRMKNTPELTADNDVAYTQLKYGKKEGGSRIKKLVETKCST